MSRLTRRPYRSFAAPAPENDPAHEGRFGLVERWEQVLARLAGKALLEAPPGRPIVLSLRLPRCTLTLTYHGDDHAPDAAPIVRQLNPVYLRLSQTDDPHGLDDIAD